jgi:hypothetical protein
MGEVSTIARARNGGEGRAAARKVDTTIHDLPGLAGVPLLDAWIERVDSEATEIPTRGPAAYSAGSLS